MKYRKILICMAAIYPFIGFIEALHSCCAIYTITHPITLTKFFVFFSIAALGVRRNINTFWWAGLFAALWQLYIKAPVLHLVGYHQLVLKNGSFTMSTFFFELGTILWLITFIVLLLVSGHFYIQHSAKSLTPHSSGTPNGAP